MIAWVKAKSRWWKRSANKTCAQCPHCGVVGLRRTTVVARRCRITYISCGCSMQWDLK